jgi:PsbN protein
METATLVAISISGLLVSFTGYALYTAFGQPSQDVSTRSTHGFTQSHHPVAYRTLTRFGRPFQQRSAKVMVSYSALGLPPQLVNRSTPRWHRRQPLPPTRFGRSHSRLRLDEERISLSLALRG